MTKLNLTWAVVCIALTGASIFVPFGGAIAAAQVPGLSDSQALDQIEPENDTIAEPMPVSSLVKVAPANEANALQPVNMVSPTDEALRLEGSGELPIQKNTLTQQQRTNFEAQVLTSLGLHATSVQEIEAVEVSQVQKVAVTLNGAARVLELYPHSLRSENFRVVVQDADGVSFDIQPPPSKTYRGSVMGDMTSLVAASIIDGQVHATITGRDGSWAVQPVVKDIAGVPTDLHAVYRIADVIPPAGECGVDVEIAALTAIEGKIGSAPSAALGTGGRTQIAFDCDTEYYVANGSSTQNTLADLEMIMNQVALVYLGEFSPDICYVNEGVKIRTSEPDPYPSTDSGTLLCDFVDEWEASPPFSNFDVAHLMTGKNLDGTTIGVAFVGVVCGDTNFTNCAGPAQPLNFGLSQTVFSTNIVSRTGLTAHELGHNWNACHCNQNTCTGGAADADCGIMWSGTGTQQSTLLFGSRSTTSMNNHRNSRTCLSGCTGTTYVDISNPSAGSGTLANPYKALADGIDWVRAGGTVRIFGGDYSGLRTIRKFLNLERHDGNVNVGQ